MSEILTLTLKTHIKVQAKVQHKVVKVVKVDKVDKVDKADRVDKVDKVVNTNHIHGIMQTAK